MACGRASSWRGTSRRGSRLRRADLECLRERDSRSVVEIERHADERRGDSLGAVVTLDGFASQAIELEGEVDSLTAIVRLRESPGLPGRDVGRFGGNGVAIEGQRDGGIS